MTCACGYALTLGRHTGMAYSDAAFWTEGKWSADDQAVRFTIWIREPGRLPRSHLRIKQADCAANFLEGVAETQEGMK